MTNPWEKISLDDYENHMSGPCILQEQALSDIMRSQLESLPDGSVTLLGISGGNGLEDIDAAKFNRVYGVDINESYLAACEKRFETLKGIFVPIKADLRSESCVLHTSRGVTANLLIEFIGIDCFVSVLKKIKPEKVSCVIQINSDEAFISQSPYAQALVPLESVHNDVSPAALTAALEKAGFGRCFESSTAVPGGKSLLRIDFVKTKI